VIDALIDKRLMVKDTRDGQVMVEVALESLLPSVGRARRLLAEERARTFRAPTTSTTTPPRGLLATEMRPGCSPARRLTEAETLAASPAFGERMAGSRDYRRLHARRRRIVSASSRKRREAEAARGQGACGHATSTIPRARCDGTRRPDRTRSRPVLAFKARDLANERANDSRLLRDVSDAQFMLADQRPGGDVRALQQLLAVNAVKPTDVVNNAHAQRAHRPPPPD